MSTEPETPQALYYYNLGAERAAQGRHAEAEAAYRKVVTVQPDFVLALGNLGVALKAQGRLDEARAVYEQALGIAPSSVWIYQNLGCVLHDMGRLGEAEHVLAQMVDLAPEDAGAHHSLAAVLHAQDKLEEAAVEYNLAAHIDPTFADAHKYLGAVLLAMGNLEPAEAAIVRAIEHAPLDAHAHVLCGVVRYRLGRLEQARTAYERALELAPDDVETQYSLAVVESQLGHEPEALAAYRRVLDLAPDHAVARHMTAVLGKEHVSMAPPDYVAEVFDAYADEYEAHMIELLGYRAPGLLGQALRRASLAARFARALDLGCGTGLMGRELRPMVDALHGVDLAARMIEQAGQSGAYDELHVADIGEYLGATSHDYDLMTAADVFVYLGDLAPVLAAARQRLRPHGLLVFSVEALEEGEFTLCSTGRFAHSPAYVHALAAAQGFHVSSSERAVLRYEDEVPVAGLLFVLCAGAGSPRIST